MKFLIVLVVCLSAFYTEAIPANYELNELGEYSPDGRTDYGESSNRGIGGVFTVESDVSECHGVSCPAGTVACSKSVQTSRDRRILTTTVKCEDAQGNVLNSEARDTENPFENTQISSFSFTGHYNYHGGNTIGVTPRSTYRNTFYNNNNNDNNNEDAEYFK